MPLRTQNLFLNSLSEDLRRTLFSLTEPVDIPERTVLYGRGVSNPYVHLLQSGVASHITVIPGSGSAEVALSGRESVLGAISLLGPALTGTSCVMQIGGSALRIPKTAFGEVFRTSEEMRARMLEYVQNLVISLSQTSACNRLHPADARLARWLLMVQDRTGTNTLEMKQVYLAEMLGSRRTTVTMAAAEMKRNGLIAYNRGRIQILNRARLRSAACSCYPVLEHLYHNLYQPPSAPGTPSKSAA